MPQLFRQDVEPQLKANADPAPHPMQLAIDEELARLKQQQPDDLQYQGLLRETRDRLQTPAAAESPLLLLTVAPERLRRVQTQSANARTVGFLGVLNLVDSVETRSWQDVSRTLAEIPESQRVRELPGQAPPQDRDQQLARILAALDVRSGRMGKFVQVGETFVPDDDAQTAEALLTLILSGSVQQQLDQLLNAALSDPNANLPSPLAMPRLIEVPESAAQATAAKGWSTIRVSSFGIDLTTGVATVRTTVSTRRNLEAWKTAFQVTSNASSTDVTAGQTEQIANDPQIAHIASLFSGLGSSQADLSKALQMGGSIRIAMSKADGLLQAQMDNVLHGRDASEDGAAPVQITLGSR